MRLLVALLALAVTGLLAGCLEDEIATGGIHPTCPYWTGTNTDRGVITLDIKEDSTPPQYWTQDIEAPVAESYLHHDGKDLDRVFFHFGKENGRAGGIHVKDATLDLTFRRVDNGQLLRSYDQSQGLPGDNNLGQDTWHFTGDIDELTLIVPLVPKTVPTSPTVIQAVWTFVPSDNNPNTAGSAVALGAIDFFYRAC